MPRRRFHRGESLRTAEFRLSSSPRLPRTCRRSVLVSAHGYDYKGDRCNRRPMVRDRADGLDRVADLSGGARPTRPKRRFVNVSSERHRASERTWCRGHLAMTSRSGVNRRVRRATAPHRRARGYRVGSEFTLPLDDYVVRSLATNRIAREDVLNDPAEAFGGLEGAIRETPGRAFRHFTRRRWPRTAIPCFTSSAWPITCQSLRRAITAWP